MSMEGTAINAAAPGAGTAVDFFNSKAGKILIAAIIVLLIIGGLVWYSYSQGKKTVTIAPLPANDNSGNNQPDSALSTIASAIHDDLAGINWFNDHNEDAYTPAMALSNYDFVRMNNIYNTQYQASDKSLYNKVNDSWSTPETAWRSTKTAFLAKLAANNITK